MFFIVLFPVRHAFTMLSARQLVLCSRASEAKKVWLQSICQKICFYLPTSLFVATYSAFPVNAMFLYVKNYLPLIVLMFCWWNHTLLYCLCSILVCLSLRSSVYTSQLQSVSHPFQHFILISSFCSKILSPSHFSIECYFLLFAAQLCCAFFFWKNLKSSLFNGSRDDHVRMYPVIFLCLMSSLT